MSNPTYPTYIAKVRVPSQMIRGCFTQTYSLQLYKRRLWAVSLYYWTTGNENWVRHALGIQSMVRLTRKEKLEFIVQVSLGLIPSPMPLIQADWKAYSGCHISYYRPGNLFSKSEEASL